MYWLRLIVLALMMLGAGCHTTRMGMQLARSLDDADSMPIKRPKSNSFGGSLIVGPWVVRQLAWNADERTCSANGASMDTINVKPYSFAITAAEQMLNVECAAKAHMRRTPDNSMVNMNNHPRLDCTFRDASGGTLHIESLQQGVYAGSAAFDSRSWAIRTVNTDTRGRTSVLGPLGYEVSDGTKVVAAMEVFKDGRAWMHPTLSAQDELRMAGIFGALLLQGPQQPLEFEKCQ